MLSDNCTSKKINLSSINCKNTLEHIKFLTRTEHKLLTKLIEKCRVNKGGHDLRTWFDNSNENLGYLVGVCAETARIAKEGLHARGIILIDRTSWDKYQKEVDGKLVRMRTPYVQRVEFTYEFIAWFESCVKNRKIPKDGLWMYSSGYVEKNNERKFKSAVAVAKFKANQLKKVLITMWNSCESVPIELVGLASNLLGSYTKTEESKLNTEDINSKTHDWLHSDGNLSIKEKLRNPLIANLASYSQKKVKTWTESTTRICKQLIDSGMTKIEVARSMVHQNYVNSIEEFNAKYSHPMNC